MKERRGNEYSVFLTPKNEVVCENIESTMRQVIEKWNITDIQLFR